MNIKKTQGLQPADAGKYRHLKKKIASLKNSLRQEELKAAKKPVVAPVATEVPKTTKKKTKTAAPEKK